MTYDFIQASLEYIEQNLKTEITAEELAAMANYSVGHFCRLFAQAMDTTVASYILKRRLDHALAELSASRKAIGVVLEYGFDTYAGFYKAFVKMYGCSPKKYLKLYKKTEGLRMENANCIQAILENWDIPKGLAIEDASTRDWRTGEIQWRMWKVGDAYYLKTGDRAAMICKMRIAKALKKEGLDSEFLPIPTKAGEDYLEGESIFMLTRKIGGMPNNRPLNNDEIGRLENNALRQENAFQLGQAIARLHRALKTVQDDVRPYEANLYAYGEQAIPRILQSPLGISEDFFTDYTETFGALYPKLPKQLIHGNLCGDMAVYEKGRVVCIKGLETFNLSHLRLFDITWSAGEINAQPHIAEYLKTLAEIARGYDSLSPLTGEEKQALYYVICATYMGGFATFDEGSDISSRSNEALVFLSENKEMFSSLV